MRLSLKSCSVRIAWDMTDNTSELEAYDRGKQSELAKKDYLT